MKVIEFDLQAWGTRLKNERNRTNAELELWVAPVSYSRASDSTYVPTTFREIAPESGWVKVTESIFFYENSSSVIPQGELGRGSADMIAYSQDNPKFYFRVPDNYDKFAIKVIDCNFCKNLGKTVLMSGSLYRNDPMPQRQSYPFSSSNWMND